MHFKICLVFLSQAQAVAAGLPNVCTHVHIAAAHIAAAHIAAACPAHGLTHLVIMVMHAHSLAHALGTYEMI